MPPDFVVLVIEPPSSIFAKIKEFPQFFSFIFTNYELIKNFEDIWILKLKEGKVKTSTEILIDPEFAKKYFWVSEIKDDQAMISPFEGLVEKIPVKLTKKVKKLYKEVPISISFFGLVNQDQVGMVVEKPSGVNDLNLKVEGILKPIKMISIKRDNNLWVYPANGLNSIIKVISRGAQADLYFEPPANPAGDYELIIIYKDNTISRYPRL
jgi:hypothetical protein